MRIYRNRFFEISPAFYIIITLACLLFPVRWVFAWFIAGFVHEFSHYLALKICNVQIYTIFVGPLGAKIETEPMEAHIEIISALAGPLGGICMILFARIVPLVALFAVFQSVFNLLPLYPLDGARALKCFLESLFAKVGGKLFYWIEFSTLLLLLLLVVIVSCSVNLGPIPVAWFVLLMLRNKISLQRVGTNSTIVPADVAFVKSREEYITND